MKNLSSLRLTLPNLASPGQTETVSMYTRELSDFVRESNRIEGILRDPTERELEAHADFLCGDSVSIDDLCLFVGRIAPGHRLRDTYGLNVRVGNHIAPPGGPGIPKALNKILKGLLTSKTPHEVHVAYEILHPFTDGNGRSGRALWLWMMRGNAPLGFLHTFYYQTLSAAR